ncbi:fibronectin type III domain-containing protein [Pedobacter sp. B4-66]|uniref:YncE family protein n=1 Tax=Pedobacter sp. B4-66 TaxID=2817280 RepID=UPI001BDB6718|nr:fibronectin type III domain-containing protein [Pedobacter sp. B4-66]
MITKFLNSKCFLSILTLSICFFCACKKDKGLNDNTSKENPLRDIEIAFLRPEHTDFVQGDTINFEVELQGKPIGDLSNIIVTWRSNIDGVLKEVKGVRDLKLVNTSLSAENHIISIEIKNELDSVKKAFLPIQVGVRLLKLEKTDNSITLRWKKYSKENFKSYKLVRYKNNQADTLSMLVKATDTAFSDKSIVPGVDYKYMVVVSKTIGNLKSNEQFVVGGSFIEMNYPILKLLKDPFRDRVYAIVAGDVHYGNNLNGYGIIAINTKDLKVEKRLFEHIRYTDFTISLDGRFLYLADESTTIQKIDLETLTSAGTIQTNSEAYHIKAGSNNRLYYHITPPTSGSTEFRIVDLALNKELAYKDNMTDAQRGFHMGNFDLDPTTNTIYHVESLSSATISKITTGSDIFMLENSRSSNRFSLNPIFNIIKQRLFVNEKVYDKSLSIVGEFYNGNSEAIITAVSPSGNFALSFRDLYDTNTFKKIESIKGILDNGIFLSDKQLMFCNTEKLPSNEYRTRIFRYTLGN